MQAYHQYGVASRPALYITKKGALDSQPHVIKFTSWLPVVGGSLRLLPASSTTKTVRHDIAEILLKVALKHQKSIQINHFKHKYKMHMICIIRLRTFDFCTIKKHIWSFYSIYNQTWP